MNNWKYVSNEITRKFCDDFKKNKEAFRELSATTIASGELPAGVDPNNKKVQDIVRQCRMANPEIKHIKLKRIK